jgi:hypothetical protein
LAENETPPVAVAAAGLAADKGGRPGLSSRKVGLSRELREDSLVWMDQLRRLKCFSMTPVACCFAAVDEIHLSFILIEGTPRPCCSEGEEDAPYCMMSSIGQVGGPITNTSESDRSRPAFFLLLVLFVLEALLASIQSQ